MKNDYCFFARYSILRFNSWEWTHEVGRDERVVGVHVWRISLQTGKLPVTDRR